MRGTEGWRDRHEHSVLPASDYDYACERYSIHDPRQLLTEMYCALLADRLHYKIFNCKIDMLGDDGYNVFLYMWDAQRDLGDHWWVHSVDGDRWGFTRLFLETLSTHPIEALRHRAINPNGVLVQDFRLCSIASTLGGACGLLLPGLMAGYPTVTSHEVLDDRLYLFFTTSHDLTRFQAKERTRFIKELWRLTRPFDRDGFFADRCPVTVILDLQSTMDAYGDYHYFNGDAMNGLARL